MSPLILFQDWYKEELELNPVEIPSACCLSTVGLDGHPNARFVSLKTIREDKFVVSGPMNSRKGLEMKSNPKVALTFWWTNTKRQVRIQGLAALISKEEALSLFSQRNRDSQLVSQAFDQGKPLPDRESVNEIFARELLKWEGQAVPRPVNWGGFAIDPLRLEFMEFKSSRLHVRKLFQRENDLWNEERLQP